MATNNKKTNSVIIGICAAIVVVALIAVAIVLGTRNGGFTGLSDAFFVSDGSKLVMDIDPDAFPFEQEEYIPEKVYQVYFYSGDTINGLKAYYKYSDEEKAKAALSYLADSFEGDYKSISQDGEYVILEANESEYEGVQANDVKQQIEFIEMIKKQEAEDAANDAANVEDVDLSGDETNDTESE